jgi:hypothetical protein
MPFKHWDLEKQGAWNYSDPAAARALVALKNCSGVMRFHFPLLEQAGLCWTKLFWTTPTKPCLHDDHVAGYFGRPCRRPGHNAYPTDPER